MNIKLNPKDAIRILSFLREFIKEDEDVEFQFLGLKESIDAFANGIYNRITDEELDEAIALIEIDALQGKSPPSKR